MIRSILLAVLAALLTACTDEASAETPVITPEIFGVTVIPQATPTPTAQPTPTPEPLAARVNGRPITLAEYEAELARYLAALPDAPDPNSDRGRLLAQQLREAALEALIEQALIEEEATRNGIQVSDQQVAEELTIAKARAGGEAQFQAWLAATQQTEESVRALLRREMLASAVRDRVLAALPRTAEYVHAYHIVVATEHEARQALTRLQNGAKFTALAQSLSLDESTRANGGDLGWFTRGSGAVLWPEVEDTAFSLQPGETSDIVKSPIGYHIIRVTEREVRSLTEADTIHLHSITLEKWMTDLKSRARIERFVE